MTPTWMLWEMFGVWIWLNRSAMSRRLSNAFDWSRKWNACSCSERAAYLHALPHKICLFSLSHLFLSILSPICLRELHGSNYYEIIKLEGYKSQFIIHYLAKLLLEESQHNLYSKVHLSLLKSMNNNEKSINYVLDELLFLRKYWSLSNIYRKSWS